MTYSIRGKDGAQFALYGTYYTEAEAIIELSRLDKEKYYIKKEPAPRRPSKKILAKRDAAYKDALVDKKLRLLKNGVLNDVEDQLDAVMDTKGFRKLFISFLRRKSKADAFELSIGDRDKTEKEDEKEERLIEDELDKMREIEGAINDGLNININVLDIFEGITIKETP